MRKRSQLYKYLLSDFLTSAIAWLLFNAIRYDLLAQYQFSSLASYLMSDDVLRGQLLVPFGWLILHYYSGYYNNSLEKSRLAELFTTLQTAFIGSLVIFFVVVLKRLPKSFHIYYELVGSLFALSFVCMYLGRLMITLLAIRKTHKKEWTIHAVILGNGEKAQNTLKELNRPSNAPGYSIQGFINTDAICPNQTAVQLPVIGELKDLEQIIKEQRIEELIIAVDTNHDATFLALLYSLYQYKLPIKLPVSYSKLLTGGINLKTITSFPLIDVTANNFSDAEKNIKLSLDKLISLLVLLLLSPLYLYLMIRVKMDSTGSVFIRQERIGKGGKPFVMYKFRTMQSDAEKGGPALSAIEDERITPYGRKMRKYRLDELPQFWNVLKGDMSIVGPRPERKHYIDQIVKEMPCFYLLHNVRPGITSWGMVKFGYASNVQQMIERMQYDILYYENMSLALDIKILIYTVKTIVTGKGI